MKRIAAFILCLLLLFGATAGILSASAKTKLDVPDNFRLLTGQFGAREESTARFSENASYAWLQDVFVRESVNSLLYSDLTPIDDYPFSTTLEGFKLEIKYYLELLNEDRDPVSMFSDFISVFEQVKIGMQALGITASEYEQRVWLEDNYDVKFPADADSTAYDSVMTSMLYLVLRYELAQALFGFTEVTVPAGLWLEEAAVLVLKAYLNENFDMSAIGENALMDIVTLNGLVTAIMRVYLSTQDIHLDDNASDLEVISALAVAVAKDAGYEDVPDIGTMTEDVLFAYELAAELYLYWGVMCPTGELLDAMASENPDDAVARIVLETMVRERASQKVVDKIEAMSDEELFNQTLILNYFDLGQNSLVNSLSSLFGDGSSSRRNGNTNGRDFYSDVYEYDIHLNYKREELLLSAFSYATLMNPVGYTKYVTLKVNGESAKLGRAIRIALDTELQEQFVDVEVNYRDDSKGINQTCHYIFNIFQGNEDPPENESGLMQNMLEAMGTVTGILSFSSSGKASAPRTATGDDDVELPQGYVPPIADSETNSLLPLYPDDLFTTASISVHTAKPVDTSYIAQMIQRKAEPTGFAAVIEKLKQDNLWIYVLCGTLALMMAVFTFIYDQKKQDAEHRAMGFKSKVGPGNKKVKEKLKVKRDDRF